jgi:hypothetical protein
MNKEKTAIADKKAVKKDKRAVKKVNKKKKLSDALRQNLLRRKASSPK